MQHYSSSKFKLYGIEKPLFFKYSQSRRATERVTEKCSEWHLVASFNFGSSLSVLTEVYCGFSQQLEVISRTVTALNRPLLRPDLFSCLHKTIISPYSSIIIIYSLALVCGWIQRSQSLLYGYKP